jgi:hypothetical protein
MTRLDKGYIGLFFIFISVQISVTIVVSLKNNYELQVLNRKQENDQLKLERQEKMLLRFKDPHLVVERDRDYQQFLKTVQEPDGDVQKALDILITKHGKGE